MRIIDKDVVDQSLYFVVLDSASTTGGRKTGIVIGSPADLVAYYTRTRSAPVNIPLVALAAVTDAHTDGGFIEVSSTNAPGLYRIDVPDAAFAAGADSVVINLKGASGMVNVEIEIQLRPAVDAQSIDGDATSAANLAKTTRAIGRGTVAGGATTTSIPTSAFAPVGTVTDQFKGRIITFDADTATAALRGQSTDITGTTEVGSPTMTTFAVTALTTAPASGDTFSVT